MPRSGAPPARTPSLGEPQDTWVSVGRIGKPFGLKGEVVIRYYGDTPARFAPGSRVYVNTREGRVRATVATARQMPRKFVVSFEGRATIEAVEAWVGLDIAVAARDLPSLEEGRYYHFQMIGLQVYAADGRCLGVLQEILATGGNDVYCVRDGRREVLIPAIAGAIDSVDLAARRMVLKDLEGLIEP